MLVVVGNIDVDNLPSRDLLGPKFVRLRDENMLLRYMIIRLTFSVVPLSFRWMVSMRTKKLLPM